MKKTELFLFGLLILFSFNFVCHTAIPPQDEWVRLEEIRNRIIPPVFPDKEFDVTKYGAVPDGKTDCTEAFKQAVLDCNRAGGGRVVVPEGTFLTGPVYLKSNVNLFISKGAVIKFSTEKEKYLPVVFTRWEGVECMNYSPLIYAFGEENIAVTGEGVLDGQGSNENWWSWKGNKESGWVKDMPRQKEGRDLLFQMGEKGIPPEERIFGEGFYLRPNFVQPYKCKNVLIDGVTFKNSPMWFLNPVLCENVTVQNLTIDGLGPNNDGCNPESSKDVLIKNCYFNTGDDCIAIKSGRNNDGRRINIPSENIIIENCTMKEGHGGVVIGSEISGGVRNVFAQNCRMNSPNLERALRIKTNSVRGGVIENIFMRNIEVGEVSEAVIKIDFLYEEGDGGAFTPVVRNVRVKNLVSEKSEFAIWIKAYQRSPVEGLSLENCVFSNVAKPNVMENVGEYNFKTVLINDQPVNK